MKVVIDANIIVSAVITNSSDSSPKQILKLWRSGTLEVAVTQEILEEIDRVLRYPKIAERHKWSDEQIRVFVSLLSKKSQIVEPDFRFNISEDESDNRYIECAVVADAKLIISGDKKHLLSIGEFAGIKIISPAAFMSLMQATAEAQYV